MTLALALRALDPARVGVYLRALARDDLPAGEHRARAFGSLARMLDGAEADLSPLVTPAGARAIHTAWLAAGKRGRPRAEEPRAEEVRVQLTAAEVRELDRRRGPATRSAYLARGLRS